jgi:hypothetical protein
MMMQRSKGGRKVEVERMVQQQEVEKAEIRKKAIDRKKKRVDSDHGHDHDHGTADIPPPKEAWEVKKATKDLHEDGGDDGSGEVGDEKEGGL